ncbi:MAG TPA: lysylphosphatidylglycerol synthase domain-containing protein [Gammaproteobacteria bacterium]
MRRFQPLIAAAAFALAAFLVHRALRDVSFAEIRAALDSISARNVLLGVAFTAGSFLCLTAFDTLAVRYTGGRLPYRKIALASFTALSIGHTLGFAALSSGALRYRFYTGWGLSPGDVGRIVMFSGVTVAAGACTTGGLAALLAPELLAATFGAPRGGILGAGVLLVAAVAAYLAWAALVRRPLRIRRFVLPVPGLGLALGQVALGATDFLLVAAVLHQMVAASADVPYAAVAAAYVLGNVAGIVTHVPGGLGVVEAVVVMLVPGAHVVGALIAFRATYYLGPFVLGCAALGVAELSRRRSPRRFALAEREMR